jgi:hypothetical protein
MGYYSMALDDEAKALCVVSLPWGLYQYNALPQGVKAATDIFQEYMGVLFLDMAMVIVYMDDIIIIGYEDSDTHLIDIEEFLKRLQEAGLQVNPEKFIWFASLVDYLGFNITRAKIQGILNMSQSRNQRDVCHFMGLVNFYKDLYPQRANTLAPLTDLCGENRKFEWKSEQENAFTRMKEIMARETMITCPQFDKPFIVYS